jgi:plasmid replication initiation protein
MNKKIKQLSIGFNGFFEELQATIRQQVSQAIEAQLETEVERWLYRDYHEKRASVTRQSQAVCQQCGSQAASAFSRNGHRPRQLVTTFGVVN